MKCPVPACTKTYTISRKAYSTYYRRKIETDKIQKPASSKWHYSAMKHHLLSAHSNDSVNHEIDPTNQIASGSVPNGASTVEDVNGQPTETNPGNENVNSDSDSELELGAQNLPGKYTKCKSFCGNY